MSLNRTVSQCRRTLNQILVKDFSDGTRQGFNGGTYSAGKLFVDTWGMAIYDKVMPSESTLKFKFILDAVSDVDTWRTFRPVQRYIDSDNNYFLSFTPNEAVITIWRRVAGSESSVATAEKVIALATEYDIEWKITGVGSATVHTLIVNGETLIASAADSGNTILSSGKIGVKNNGANGRIYDIEVIHN